MKKTLAILAAGTALAAILGIPAWSAMSTGTAPTRAIMLQPEDEQTILRLIEDDGEDEDMPKASRRGGDDDESGEDDDDDEDEGGRGASNPAPAGATPPPANGLFKDGQAPKAQVN